MDGKIIEDYRIISTGQLVRAVKEGLSNSERFCFILGSGASVSSNIPMGGELEYKWMKEMEEDPGLAEISVLAEKMKESKQLEYDFKEIEQAWQDAKKSKTPLPSKYYFDIYKLRFFPNHRNGYHYLEKIMADAKPNLGYYPLALMLTKGDGNNLVITTNFDSLVEDALFLYTNSKPLVINHELLAEFAGDSNIRRPIVAKVHRGIFFDPLNKPEETDTLKGKWHEVLGSVFQNYTPIVIGYGGGDNSLMELLTDENVKMKNGIYWCYMEEYGLPDEKIQMLVKGKKGYFVCSAGFDDTMMTIGNALFPDKMDVHEIELYLNNRTSILIENY
ncbi:MAG: SIR2 family protein, partial [Acetatifactor sp.]|nr:SIR2 family protein [Acetatifactor sp.]